MNYGQALEHLKDFGDGFVFLMGADGPYEISTAMADETGVYLVTEHIEWKPDESLDGESLLAKLRAIDPQPEFTAPMFADGPEGTGSIDTVLVSESGTLTFEAPGIHLHRDPVALDGEAMAKATAAQSGPGNPEHENAALPTRSITGLGHVVPIDIKHDFEPVPGFEDKGPGGSAPLCFHCDQRADAPVHQIAAPRHLSPPAAGVLNAMGLGMPLRVPHDGSAAMLIDSTSKGRESLGPVNPDHLQELVASGVITKLTKDRNGQRVGWAEKGFDGDVADFYVCTQ